MNDFHPLVSIVIPIYNGSNYMQCAIDSALGQDYDNVEVIVVNDGSTDNTDVIARRYGDKIRYFSKENGGVSTALNLAIQNAKGEYISWLSHDDFYLPNKLSRQLEELGKIEKRDKLIPCCDYKIIYVQEGNEKIVRVSYNVFNTLNKIDSLKILYIGTVHGCAFLIPSDAFKKVGYFNPQLYTTQDYDLWFRLINAEYLFYYIPEALVISRFHSQKDTFKKIKLCRIESLKLWKSTDKLFYNDIKMSSRTDKKIFKKRNCETLRFILRMLYINSPSVIRKIILGIKTSVSNIMKHL
jgi:glycosyltransferase involved in cell wall biosynthesis